MRVMALFLKDASPKRVMFCEGKKGRENEGRLKVMVMKMKKWAHMEWKYRECIVES